MKSGRGNQPCDRTCRQTALFLSAGTVEPVMEGVCCTVRSADMMVVVSLKLHVSEDGVRQTLSEVKAEWLSTGHFNTD